MVYVHAGFIAHKPGTFISKENIAYASFCTLRGNAEAQIRFVLIKAGWFISESATIIAGVCNY